MVSYCVPPTIAYAFRTSILLCVMDRQIISWATLNIIKLLLKIHLPVALFVSKIEIVGRYFVMGHMVKKNSEQEYYSIASKAHINDKSQMTRTHDTFRIKKRWFRAYLRLKLAADHSGQTWIIEGLLGLPLFALVSLQWPWCWLCKMNGFLMVHKRHHY